MTETQAPPVTGKGTAIAGESLYLLNLLFPVIPLLILAWLYFRKRKQASLLQQCHLIQPLIGACVTTLLFLIINGAAFATGGYRSLDSLVSIHTLLALEAYTLLVILPFIVPGLLGLTKAISGQCYRYPLLGRFL